MSQRQALRTFARGVFPFLLGRRAVRTDNLLPVLDKFTQKVAAQVCLPGADHVEEAIARAHSSRHAMANMPNYERKAILRDIAARVAARRADFVDALCIEAGKPFRDANVEVDRAISVAELSAEEVGRLPSEFADMDTVKSGAGLQMIVKRMPIGPVSMFSPFNFPLNLAMHKVAPAIAVGCPFILKPSERAPITALLLGEVLGETSLPDEAFSILPTLPDTAGPLVSDERIRMFSFTGSPKIGWMLSGKAAKKRVTLELGGTAPCIVDADADIDYAVSRITFGAFYYQGQSCISVQSVLIHESIYETVVDRLKAAAAKLVIGDPCDQNTFVGPLISQAEAERVESWVQEAVRMGARLVTGGKRTGAVVEPTILADVPDEANVCKSEVFGPVCHVKSFKDLRATVQKLNESPFGLHAGLFTRSLDHAFYAFRNLEFGGVVVNDVPSARADSMPYGGVKDSGLGREGIHHTMLDMSEPRAMLLKNIGL